MEERRNGTELKGLLLVLDRLYILDVVLMTVVDLLLFLFIY